ncbi:tellurite resistance TerB family protein [Rhodoligotrophos defluvii]|uniref:tellurite resistance TerB family protein n=1 Tax=Rhodoligotrophos defluvii TaxID=2561934 RepID=UPI0010C9D881|nr:tellurite resistance TerB family protein [Rhodoligotrophos defluvii]
MSTVGPHQALIYVMVTMSAVDNRMGDAELKRIGTIVKRLPVFRDFDPDRLVLTAQEAGELLSADGEAGLRTLLALVKQALPERLRETAYALAVEVAAADMKLPKEEIRLLQILRDTLELDKLTCAAIERSAIARYAQL